MKLENESIFNTSSLQQPINIFPHPPILTLKLYFYKHSWLGVHMHVMVDLMELATFLLWIVPQKNSIDSCNVI
jgi:hypothetical protein